MNELAEYLKKHGTAAQLAVKTGLPASLISRYKRGKMPITLRSALLINQATDGKVRAEDMVIDAWERQAIQYLRGRA